MFCQKLNKDIEKEVHIAVWSLMIMFKISRKDVCQIKFSEWLEDTGTFMEKASLRETLDLLGMSYKNLVVGLIMRMVDGRQQEDVDLGTMENVGG